MSSLQLIAILTSLLASTLTFFTGFGLGSVLLAAYVLILPVELAIASTAIVHLSNNLFKLLLMSKHAKKDVIIKFGLTAFLGALIGAAVLESTAGVPALIQYQLGQSQKSITLTKLLISLVMAIFAMLEFSKLNERILLAPKWMPFGGLLSGFFGGLSGHQGAFRTMFLLKAGLSKEQFIGTGCVIAMIVDVSRLSIYWRHFTNSEQAANANLLVPSILAALAGTLIGNKLLKKVSLRVIEIIASVLLLIISILLGSGII